MDHSGEAIEEVGFHDLFLDELVHIGTRREMVCKQLSSFVDKGGILIICTEYVNIDRGLQEEMAEIVKG